MGLSRNKGSYHERWWCKWFTEKGCAAKRQPLSGAMGGEFASDIKIHHNQPADLYLYKKKTGAKFIVIEADSKLAIALMDWLGGRDT